MFPKEGVEMSNKPQAFELAVVLLRDTDTDAAIELEKLRDRVAELEAMVTPRQASDPPEIGQWVLVFSSDRDRLIMAKCTLPCGAFTAWRDEKDILLSGVTHYFLLPTVPFDLT